MCNYEKNSHSEDEDDHCDNELYPLHTYLNLKNGNNDRILLDIEIRGNKLKAVFDLTIPYSLVSQICYTKTAMLGEIKQDNLMQQIFGIDFNFPSPCVELPFTIGDGSWSYPFHLNVDIQMFGVDIVLGNHMTYFLNMFLEDEDDYYPLEKHADGLVLVNYANGVRIQRYYIPKPL